MSKTKSMPSVDRKWEVEDAARTLRRAFEIKADPKLAKAAQAKLKEEQSALSKTIKDMARQRGLK